ncbi:MAG: glycosyl hydrolase family 57 [Alphaproteobacteria bacterium]|nr:MAG: glycosyl hydrolase family 57 [Alphaproteobacteria bacterium]
MTKPLRPICDDGLPNIAGHEKLIEKTIKDAALTPVFRKTGADFGPANAVFAIALHMHQPLIPAGGADMKSATIISNLKDMMDHQGAGDNHNAPVFAECYKRLGDFIPELLKEGKQPKVMLEYSGTLLYGLQQMGRDDVIDALKKITCDPAYRDSVEWLGCPWGHAVAPSTPVQDFKLHVKAWQHNFAAIFGTEALERVRGFSPSEMALPNNPDVAYEFVKTLKDCGYQWVLVQHDTIENPTTRQRPDQPHLPQRLVCTNSKGETVEITAIVKTQGSDTKLVGQMQPYYEAKTLKPVTLAGKTVPPLVTQIADGENGGVMMNEFPPKYKEAVRECSGTRTPMMNVTEYLEHLAAMGITEKDFPAVQPAKQAEIWKRMTPGDGPEKLAEVIETCKKDVRNFNMEGGSWTNNISWVQGYDNVLKPMEKLSEHFNRAVLEKNAPTDEDSYRRALFQLLTAETSCFRYWGQGVWTDYARELCRRGEETLDKDYPDTLKPPKPPG